MISLTNNNGSLAITPSLLNALPECDQMPIKDNQLTTKSYVDNKVLNSTSTSTTQINDINLSDYSSSSTSSSGLLIANGKGAINIILQKNTINYITNNLDINYYSPLLAGLNGYVNALTMDASGNLFAGGSFTATSDGITTLNYIAKWNGTTWSSLGPGLSSSVSALTMDASGNLIVGGVFTTTFGGTANSLNYIAKWNGTAWSALGTGLNATVNALTMDASGNLYAGGAFTATPNGDGTYKMLYRIAKWNVNGSGWSGLSTASGIGLNNTVNALTMDASGNLIVGGVFTTTFGGTALNYIAKWDVVNSAWSALGAGLNATVSALTMDASGNLFAGGSFTSTFGGTANLFNRIAKWNVNGSTWSGLSTGLNATVNALTMDASGNLFAGGSFTSTFGGTANSLNYVCKINLTTLNIFNVDISVNNKFLNTLFKSQTLSANVTNNSICYSSNKF